MNNLKYDGQALNEKEEKMDEYEVTKQLVREAQERNFLLDGKTC